MTELTAVLCINCWLLHWSNWTSHGQSNSQVSYYWNMLHKFTNMSIRMLKMMQMLLYSIGICTDICSITVTDRWS